MKICKVPSTLYKRSLLWTSTCENCAKPSFEPCDSPLWLLESIHSSLLINLIQWRNLIAICFSNRPDSLSGCHIEWQKSWALIEWQCVLACIQRTFSSYPLPSCTPPNATCTYLYYVQASLGDYLDNGTNCCFIYGHGYVCSNPPYLHLCLQLHSMWASLLWDGFLPLGCLQLHSTWASSLGDWLLPFKRTTWMIRQIAPSFARHSIFFASIDLGEMIHLFICHSTACVSIFALPKNFLYYNVHVMTEKTTSRWDQITWVWAKAVFQDCYGTPATSYGPNTWTEYPVLWPSMYMYACLHVCL